MFSFSLTGKENHGRSCRMQLDLTETKSQHHFPPSASAVPSTDSHKPKGLLARTPHRIYPNHPLGLALWCPMEPLGDWLFLAPMTTVALTGTLSVGPTQPIRSLRLSAFLGWHGFLGIRGRLRPLRRPMVPRGCGFPPPDAGGRCRAPRCLIAQCGPRPADRPGVGWLCALWECG